MENLIFSEMALQEEIERIVDFIRKEAGDQKLLIGLSGGIDSDVTARLCYRAVGGERLKCFTVLQDEFDPKFIANAQCLARDLGVKLVEIPLASYPLELMTILSSSDPEVGFVADAAYLDVGRSKCAIRTFLFSAYAERGYLVVGPSNRTELELGYFLPFGDKLAHICPIIHLYKTQVQQLAKAIGTRPEVITQPPAAGFWIGDEDLKGIAYWLYNGAPIKIDLKLGPDEKEVIKKIREELSFYAIDLALQGINLGESTQQISKDTGLSIFVIERLVKLAREAFSYKRREFGKNLG